MADPSDFKFSPTDERLVGYYLRNRVYTGQDGFIKDIKLYEDEPWLLPHVNNVQFEEKKWFYFVVRPRGSRNGPRRTVRGRGGSNGGTWTTTGTKKEIYDRNKMVVIGYKNELAYYKKVKGKAKGDTTGWCMTEYWLASENDAQLQDVVLCHLRNTKNTEVNGTVVDHLRLQQQVENRDDDNDMFDIDELLDFTRPLVSPSQDMIPPLQGQDSRFPVQDMIPVGEGEGLGQQDIKEYVDELENMLEEDDGDDDHKATQQQHPQVQDSCTQLVVMEDECVNQEGIFNLLDEQEMMMMNHYGCMSSTRLEMQNNLIYLQDSAYQEMSPWNNMVTNNPYGVVYNTHGYEMQVPPVSNGVNQDSY